MIELQNVSKEYYCDHSVVTVLQDTSYVMPSVALVALVGPSGIGKSTLLHLCGLLDTCTSGCVLIDGQKYVSEKTMSCARLEKIGFIYQSHYLTDEMTVLENILMPAAFRKTAKIAALEYATFLLEQVGMEQYIHRYPSQLSGGQKQRVAIVRALINKPTVLLADEPTGNLDRDNARQVIELMVKLTHMHKISTIVATHDREIAAQADQIITIKDYQIHLEQK